MPRTDHDLPLDAYCLIGLVVVGQDIFGYFGALLLALAFVGMLIAMSALTALVSCLAPGGWSVPYPHKWVGPQR
jgi:NADH:ubiquinone oxidoreductase subunit H